MEKYGKKRLQKLKNLHSKDKKYKRNKSYKDITRSKIKLLTLNTLKEKSKNDSEKYMIIHSESNKNENTIDNIKQKLHNELHMLKL